MMRLLGRALLGIVVVAAVVYVGDWAVWAARNAGGGGVGSVEVIKVVVAPLKGNKEEYYPEGSAVVQCSQSLFPWTGAGACWYVERHRMVEDR